MAKTTRKSAAAKRTPAGKKGPARRARTGPERSASPARARSKGAPAEKKRAHPPAAAARQAAIERPDPSRPRALAIAKAGLDKKAEDVVVLDVRGLTSYADYFVVMTADSERQAGAIADHVDDTLKAAGTSKVGVEGHAGGRWVLIDYGDVVAHVFNRDARGFYDLEGLWADAPRLRVEA